MRMLLSWIVIFTIVKVEIHLGTAKMLGGLSEERAVTADDPGFKFFMDAKVKAKVEEISGKSFEMYKPLKYRSRTVQGILYFVKIQVNTDGECVHVKIWQHLVHTEVKLEVGNVQTGRTVDSPISRF